SRGPQRKQAAVRVEVRGPARSEESLEPSREIEGDADRGRRDNPVGRMVGSNWKITRFIQDRFRRVARWVGKHPKVARFFSVTRKAVVRWMMHGGARMAAALAFYTAI